MPSTPIKYRIYEVHLDRMWQINSLVLVHVDRETRPGKFPASDKDTYTAASADSKGQNSKVYQCSLFKATASQMCFTNAW
jgi:hypothetical protein